MIFNQQKTLLQKYKAEKVWKPRIWCAVPNKDTKLKTVVTQENKNRYFTMKKP